MYKIMAIDDEETCLEIINFSLSSKGYEVYSFMDGLEAIDFLKKGETEIDLILLDMMMPKMSGLEVLNKIRQVETVKRVPIIFQTGTSEYESMRQRQEQGCVEYIIRKPYKRDELLKLISEVLEERRIEELV